MPIPELPDSPEIARVIEAAARRDLAIVEFVDAIKAATEAGHTVRDVAAAAKISPSYVSRLVSGQRGARRGNGSEGIG